MPNRQRTAERKENYQFANGVCACSYLLDPRCFSSHRPCNFLPGRRSECHYLFIFSSLISTGCIWHRFFAIDSRFHAEREGDKEKKNMHRRNNEIGAEIASDVFHCDKLNTRANPMQSHGNARGKYICNWFLSICLPNRWITRYDSNINCA